MSGFDNMSMKELRDIEKMKIDSIAQSKIFLENARESLYAIQDIINKRKTIDD